MSPPLTVRLWLSTVSLRAPSNAAGARAGLGWTKAAASAAAAHWHNQAPYEQFSRATLSDHAGPCAAQEGEEQTAWRAFHGLDDCAEFDATGRCGTALAHYRALRYASAWLALHPAAPSVRADP